MTQALATPTMARSSRARRGFTLVEILVALAVLAVGTSVFIQLFNSSLNVAHKGNDRRVAVALAEEQLNTLLQHPEQFQWAAPEADGAQFPITALADKPLTNPLEPAIAPVEVSARKREQYLYEQFQWRAFGVKSNAEAIYCEVTVEISWTYAGRKELLALTSCMPISQIPTVGEAQ